MNCTRFGRWLDEGMPFAGAWKALAHAATCERCAEAQRAALELETLLALEPIPAPAAIRDAVVQRIGAERRAAAVEATTRALPPEPLPWWVQAAGEPRLALGVAAAVLLYRGADSITSLFASVGPAVRTSLGSFGAQIPPLVNPVSWFGLAWAAVPVGLLAAVALYRGVESWIQRAALGGRWLGRE